MGVLTEKQDKAVANVMKAINGLFNVKPPLTPTEAREILKDFQHDLEIMLVKIESMEAMGVDMDRRPE